MNFIKEFFCKCIDQWDATFNNKVASITESINATLKSYKKVLNGDFLDTYRRIEMVAHLHNIVFTRVNEDQIHKARCFK